ncbi:MAG: hypothetical protein R3236_08705, partial [Phycisphaeraceae bacterium]|nr:hypothetical protein [Phycisphaeraceae bacterium]
MAVTDKPRSFVHTVLCALWLVLTASVAGAATEGKLYWKNGDMLPGTLLATEGERLRWASPIFDRPMLLEANKLESVVLNHTADKADEAFRVRTTDGDVLVVDWVAAEPEAFVFRSKRHGEVRLARSAVARLTRIDHPDLLYLGPSGLAGWSAPNVGPLAGKDIEMVWAEGREGHLSTRKKGATLFRPFDPWPKVLQVSCSVATTSPRPGFVLALGQPAADAVRVETWQDELVAVYKNRFEPLAVLGQDDSQMGIRLVYRREAGRLEVFDAAGKRLGSLDGIEQEESAVPGVLFRSRGEQLTLRRLEVRKGTSKAVSIRPLTQGLDQVHLIDGQVLEGVIGDSGPGQSLTVRHGEKVHQVPVEQVDRLRRSAKRVSTEDQVYLIYHDGSRISGKLRSIGPDRAMIKTAYSPKPVMARLKGVQKIWLGPKTKNDDNRASLDKLYCEAGKLHGRLIGGGPGGAPIQWRPTGGVESVGLSVDANARIIRSVEKSASSHDPKKFGDVVYLRSHEVIPCRVVSVGEKFLVMHSAFSGEDRIPLEQVKAI